MHKRARARYEKLCPDALERRDDIELDGPSPEYVQDDGRYSGLDECEICGNQLYDHPSHPYCEWLVILCDGKLAKL